GLRVRRGGAGRFLSRGRCYGVPPSANAMLELGELSSRHNYLLALAQNHIERILADWVAELAVPIHRGRAVTDLVQDDGGVDVALSDGQSLRARYVVGCDGGR